MATSPSPETAADRSAEFFQALEPLYRLYCYFGCCMDTPHRITGPFTDPIFHQDIVYVGCTLCNGTDYWPRKTLERHAI
jgi:hypothetical protein